MSDDRSITGGQELDAFLRTLPDNIQKNILRSGLRAGAKVYLNDLKQRIPVAPPNSESEQLYGDYEGALRDSARITAKVKDGVATASVKVGGKTKRGASVFYAHMVEFGTKPHKIKARRGRTLLFRGVFVKEIDHPGAKAQPFMRPSFDGTAGAAIEAVAAQIRKRLTKEGLTSPAPEGE